MRRLLERSVSLSNGCRVWLGARNRKYYGQIRVGGKLEACHRTMFKMIKGEIPKGIQICHTCDTPQCINPNHLWAGTNRENSHDMVAKGRSHGQNKKSCPRGHPLSGSNLYMCPRGYRECKQCRRENVRRYRK